LQSLQRTRNASLQRPRRWQSRAEAQRDLDIQKAQFTEQSRKQEAQADKAYEIQTNVMQQQVIAEAG